MKIFAPILLLAAACVLGAADYRILGRIPIGGEGGWDYLTVDSAAGRLYVSHATHVVVVDIATQKVVGDIPDTQGVHGITIASDLKRGYVSNGRANNVTVFDLETGKTTDHIQAGQNPDAIIYDAHSKRVFTLNGRSKDSTVIDAASGTVKATIPLDGKPEFAVVDGKGKLWVNIEDTHEIAEINTANASVSKRYSLTGCEEPSGLAFDPQRRRLFSVCDNKVMAISDPDAGKVVATVPIGAGPDGAAFDPELHIAYSSNGEGNITAVEEVGGKYRVASTIPTERGARTIALDPKTHKLYLPTAQFSPLPESAPKGSRPPMLADTFHVLVIGR